ncbi:MAG: CoA-binding protein [Acidaminococcaceae bacterium]
MIEAALNKKVWAVVGANGNKDKFGCKIYKRLVQAGYEVYPVNPGLTEIAGEKCYATLTELPVVPDVVNVIVPAKIAVTVVEEAAALGIKLVWLQPGSDKPAVITAAHDLKLDVICDCVLVQLGKKDAGK